MAEEKKFFDVSKPGKSAPASTARPVIVSNRTMVKDPTLKHEAEPESDTDKPISTQAKTIDPPSGLLKNLKEETPEDNQRVSEPAPRESEAQAVPEPDSQIEQSRIEQVKKSQTEQADLARKSQIDQLVKSQKYVVPIGHIKRNRRIRRTLLVLLLAIMLVAVAGYLLIDAQIIKVDVTLPINVIPD